MHKKDTSKKRRGYGFDHPRAMLFRDIMSFGSMKQGRPRASLSMEIDSEETQNRLFESRVAKEAVQCKRICRWLRQSALC